MSTQMTPTDFRDRLDAELSAGGEPATSAAIDGDMLLGRKMLRRRRAGVAAGTMSLVAAAAVVVGLLVSADQPTEAPGVADAPSSDEKLLAACRDGAQSGRATRLIFGPGDPVIKLKNTSDRQTLLVLEAADGRHWAMCWAGMKDAEFPSGMEVYDASGEANDFGYSTGAVCDNGDNDCHTYLFSMVDRRPAEVAAVEFWTADGERTTVETVDGYFVFDYSLAVPEGAPTERYELLTDFHAIKRITFLDRSGEPIAAQTTDGSGGGPDGEKVPGLPGLGKYPALRAPQAIH